MACVKRSKESQMTNRAMYISEVHKDRFKKELLNLHLSNFEMGMTVKQIYQLKKCDCREF